MGEHIRAKRCCSQNHDFDMRDNCVISSFTKEISFPCGLQRQEELSPQYLVIRLLRMSYKIGKHDDVCNSVLSSQKQQASEQSQV